MEGDEPCQVCGKGHREARPWGLEYGVEERAKSGFIGPEEVVRQEHIGEQVLAGYERDLEMMVGLCGYCWVHGLQFEHARGRCSRRFEWIKAKREVQERAASTIVSSSLHSEFRSFIVAGGRYSSVISRDWKAIGG
jgi:hypothetical protein